MTIYKYPLLVADLQHVEMPLGAQILCVQVQRGDPCLWALVDPDSPKTRVPIEIYGTGDPIETGTHTSRSHIGTFQLEGGSLVFHVFERI